MLSPESLVILGKGVGDAGDLFLMFLPLAIFTHFFTALTYGELGTIYPGSEGEVRLLKETFGSTLATVLPLSSRALFVICASTGILATAGYVFNEVFVNWFPNLGFSFCLLGFLLVVNLLGRNTAAQAQIIFVSVALLSLMLIILLGSSKIDNAMQFAQTTKPASMGLTRLVLVGLLLFIGYDLGVYARCRDEKYQGSLVVCLLSTILLVAAVFSLWGLVSLLYVPMERLADSTIPHMIAARAIWGQHGRVTMGIVVLAASLSVVNGLFYSVSRMLSGMARENLLPALFARGRGKAPVGLIFLAVGIAAMMALGMADEPVLEIYIRSALLFWLLNYAAIHYLVLVAKKRFSSQEFLSQAGWHPAFSVIGFLVMLMGFAGLLWTDPSSIEVIEFMLFMFTVLVILSFVWLGFRRSRRSPVLGKTG
jgi:amino acid transporter